MDKIKSIEYIIVNLQSVQGDLQDILSELDFSQEEYLTISKANRLLATAIELLNSISQSNI